MRMEWSADSTACWWTQALGRNLDFILRAVGSHWHILDRGESRLIRSASLQHSFGCSMNNRF